MAAVPADRRDKEATPLGAWRLTDLPPEVRADETLAKRFAEGLNVKYRSAEVRKAMLNNEEMNDENDN